MKFTFAPRFGLKIIILALGVLMVAISKLQADQYHSGKTYVLVSEGGSLPPEEIISAYNVGDPVQILCSYRCLKEPKCLGFNFKTGIYKKFGENCQITKFTKSKQQLMVVKGEWTFFQDIDAKLKSETREQLHIYVESRGFYDSQGPVAVIKVNNIDHSKNKRGFNFVIVDGKTGLVESSTFFDTFLYRREAARMAKFIDDMVRMNASKIILAAINDEGSRYMSAEAYGNLSRVSAQKVESLGHRDSFALIGFSETEKPSFVKQMHQNGTSSPSVVKETIKIPLKK